MSAIILLLHVVTTPNSGRTPSSHKRQYEEYTVVCRRARAWNSYSSLCESADRRGYRGGLEFGGGAAFELVQGVGDWVYRSVGLS